MIVTEKIGPEGIAPGDRIYFGTPYGDPYIVRTIERLTREKDGETEVWFAVRFTVGGRLINGGTPYWYIAEDLLDVEVEI